MKMLSLSLLTCCALSSFAFADVGPGAEQAPMPAAVTTLSFDSLRSACLNPAKFHNQIAPKNIQVSCTDMQTKWVPDTDGSLHLNKQRDVTVSMMSDKYSAASFTGPVGCTDEVVSCPQYKQITETVEVIHPTTCDELTAFTGTSIDFCVNAANAIRASNPGAVTVVATGQVISLCTGTVAQQDRK